MKQMMVRCDWCGVRFEKLTCELYSHNFCSREHFYLWNGQRMRKYNQCVNAMNKPGGIMESRIKRGNLMRGRGEGKTYTKRLGKHEHRLVAEEKLGRPLRKGEVVHHIDEKDFLKYAANNFSRERDFATYRYNRMPSFPKTLPSGQMVSAFKEEYHDALIICDLLDEFRIGRNNLPSELNK